MSTSQTRAIEALRVTVAALSARVSVLEHRVKRPTDLELITAIATATVGRAFSAIELHHHARRVDPELLAHLHRVEAVTIRQTGKLLARLSKQMHGNYRLTRVGRDGAGTIWQASVV